MTDPKPIVVAIDGPAASGKGTISRRLAARFSLAHLDTGLLYRSVASKALAEGVDPGDERLVEQIADDLTQEDLHRSDLRTIEVAKAASMVAALSGVRRSLLDYQRWFAANPHGGLRGAVLDGRDIGTVICPDATVKLFITASPEERARRRCAELESRGEEASYEAVLADVIARDKRDTERASAPLIQAADAHLLDTTHLDIDTAVDKAASIVEPFLS